VLGLEEFADTGQGIDFGDGFVWAQTHDAREAEGEAAIVAIGSLDVVEGHFEDDGGFDIALETAVSQLLARLSLTEGVLPCAS